MSVRGNVFLVERGQLTIAFDKWIGQRIPSLLYGGPSWTIRSALDFAIEDAPLTEVWAEGAALVDVDARRVLFFGGDGFVEQPWARRVAIALLRQAWRGWDVAHADESQSGLLRMLGLPVVTKDDAFAALDEIPVVPRADDANALVHVEGRGVVALRIARSAWNTPTTIDVVLARSGAVRELREADVAAPPTKPVETNVFSGASIDPRTKITRIWDHRAQPHVRGRIAAALPDWHIEWQDDGLDGMLRAAGVDPAPWVVPVADAIDEAWPKVDAAYGWEAGARRVAVNLVRDGHAPVSLLTRRGLRPEDVRPWLANAVTRTRIW